MEDWEPSRCWWDAWLQKQHLYICNLDIPIPCPSAKFAAMPGVTLKSVVAVSIQKFCESDRCLNVVCKVKTKAAGSNACCAETQAGKMLSTEEIFIFQPVVTPLWSHCARLCSPNHWSTNPGEEGKWRCDQGTTTERG